MSLSKQTGYILEDIYDICRSDTSLHNWCREKGLIGEFSGECDKCHHGNLNLRKDKSYSKDGVCYRCTNKKCNFKQSIRAGSWFCGSHLLMSQIVKLTYFWVKKQRNNFTEEELRLSGKTVVDWYNFAREVCTQIIVQDSQKVGGPGKIVEIDESKFGKRKNNKGRMVEGQWVFGGIERGTNNCFFETVHSRDSATLLPIIQRWVEPGTIIYSDCWKAYNGISQLPENYTHLTVNHSENFVDPVTGAHTQGIESRWHALKGSLPRTGVHKKLLPSYFSEYVVRKRYLDDSPDRFQSFLDLVKRVYVPRRREITRGEIVAEYSADKET